MSIKIDCYENKNTKVVTFQYYPAEITQSRPIGEITLERFLGSIKYPKKNIADTFEKIKRAQEAGDMAEKNRLKTSLFAFTPCVYVSGSRKYENIKNWTGLLAVDFDKLPSPEYAKEFKYALFKEYKFIIASWLSPSRYGVRALIKIPVVHSVGEFKEYFNAIDNELSMYTGWDRACQNCILPMFLSYDNDLLEREDYTEWKHRMSPPPVPVPVQQYIINDKSGPVERIIAGMINRIESNGHPQLRAAAYLLGGYVGSGQIDFAFAVSMMDKMIDGNAYLCQKASTYKRTSRTMITKGQGQPVFLK